MGVLDAAKRLASDGPEESGSGNPWTDRYEVGERVRVIHNPVQWFRDVGPVGDWLAGKVVEKDEFSVTVRTYANPKRREVRESQLVRMKDPMWVQKTEHPK